jgi:14-3-3 protein epsilon
MDHPNLDGLSLHEEEEEGFSFEFEEEGEEQVDLRWCLVGRFLCDRTIHFNSMRVRMADLWKPVKGVIIKEAKPGMFLFHFAHPLDMEAVLNGGPWTFDNNMLILEQVQLGVQIEQIPLFHATMWVQVHNLPTGLMKERVGLTLANYIGTFVEYDKNNNSSFWRQHMRIRVRIDVRKPLKKDAKVKNRDGAWCTVNFKYEKLGVFCFICGIMGHGENKCEVRYAMEQDDGRREWSADIRVEPRRQGGRLGSRWLREEGGGREETNVTGGGDREERTNLPTNDQAGGPLVANVAAHGSASSAAINHQLIMSKQQQLLPNQNIPSKTVNALAVTTSQIPLNSTFNHIGQSSQQLSNLFTNKASASHIPIINLPDITLNPLYSQSVDNQQTLSLTYQTETETNKHQSLPNQCLVFSSQPDPSNLTLTNNKKTRGPMKPNKINRTTIVTQPDPKPYQPRPDKKPKPTNPENNPTQNPKPKNLTQEEHEAMEVQGEKKRRRDDAVSINKDNSDVSMHFLTAGPGSQACRDQ